MGCGQDRRVHLSISLALLKLRGGTYVATCGGFSTEDFEDIREQDRHMQVRYGSPVFSKLFRCEQAFSQFPSICPSHPSPT